MVDLAPIDEKLAKKLAGIVRLLASNRQGEAAAAMQAFGRTLQSAGADVIHSVAERIEHPGDKLSDAEMQEILDAGIKIGLQKAKQQQNGHAGATLQMPSARVMALWCYEHIDELHDEKDREFVRSIVSWTRRREPTPRQQPWLEDIYIKTGGQL